MDLPFKTRLALKWQGRKLKWFSGSKQLTISNQKGGISSLLILLPELEEQLKIAVYFVQALMNSIGSSGPVTLRFVGRDFLRNTFEQNMADAFRGYSEIDIDRWGMLKSSALNRILSRHWDAAVDLSPDFHPVTTQIIGRSRAHLRIGFYDEEKEPFFNVLLERDKDDYIEKGYLRIQKLLGL